MNNGTGDQRLARGASIAAAGMIFQQAISLLSGLIVARIIGAAEYGIFNLARNLVQLASIATRLGVDLGLQRFIGGATEPAALERWKGTVTRLRLLGLFASLLPCLAVGFGGGDLLEKNVYQYEHFADVLLVICFSLPFLTDLAILGGAYRGIKHLTPSIVAELVLLPALRLGTTVLLFAFGWRLWAAVAGGSLAALLAATYLAWRAQRDFPVSWQSTAASWPDCRQILAVSVVLAGSMAISALTRSTDILILGHYAPAAEVGQYALAQMMLIAVSLFGTAFGQSLGPLVAERHAAGDLPGMGSLLRNNSRWVALVTCPIYAIFLVWGHELALIFGPSFAMPQSMVAWLGAGVLLLTILATNGYALSMTGNHKVEFMLLLVGLPLSIACCAWAVPRWGQTGAAAGSFVALAVVNLLRVWWVQRLFRIDTVASAVIPLVVLNIVAAFGIGWLTQQAGLPAVVRVPAGVTLFVLVSLAGTWQLGLDQNERLALHGFFNRINLRAGAR